LRCYDFNQTVNNLPKNLTHLTFGFLFNQPVDNLPKTLTHLTFGFNFNQQVDNLPCNIKYLSIDCNSKIINNLPQFIEELVIKTKYGIYEIVNLPYSLKKITIDKRYLSYLKNIRFGVDITYCH
jgi:hypothetical protein